MDAEDATRLETLVRALDEVLEFHERAGGAPPRLVEELRANRANLVRRLASSTVAECVNCERRTEDPDRDGWHVFSDGADERHVVCADCAAATTPGGGPPIPLRLRAARKR
jgi:hypothetical protein